MSIDWPALLREIGEEVASAVAELTTGERCVEAGIGAGGDTTAAVDALAEQIVLARLAEVATARDGLAVVSEERGALRFGGDPRWWVVVDPIDGSANAKRGLPYFGISLAVADEPTYGGVAFAAVRDLTSGATWTAERGAGAWLDGRSLPPVATREDLELVELSGTSVELVAAQAPLLTGHTRKVRVMGSIALSLCQLASGRLDAVVSLRRVRSVDIAAAQLVVREQGLAIELTDGPPLVGAPLDLTRRSRVVAAATLPTVRRLGLALGPALP